MFKDSNTSNLINFKDTFQLLKNYLSKKRFSYVYEQAVKFLNKNNALLANHEILQLCSIIFFVLQKKFKSKLSPKNQSLNNLSIKQIQKNMINTYISWQNLITTQLNSQDSQFFNMLYRKNKESNYMSVLQMQTFQYESKLDFVVTKKLNIQFELFSFLKQTLRIMINTLINLAINQSFKCDQVVSIIQRGQHIISKFTESHFFIEKVQFQIVKYQILQSMNLQQRNLVIKRGISIKYNFPVGLICYIYKNLNGWSQLKLDHYIKLLCKYSFMCIKNCIMTITEIYILISQLKKLKETVKNNYHIGSTSRTGRMEKDLQFSIHDKFLPENNQKIEQKNKNQKKKKIKTKDSFSVNKIFKKKLQLIMKTIIQIIEQYIFGRKQVQYIIKCYAFDFYKKYSKLSDKDQIITENVILNIKQTAKKKNILDKTQILSNKMSTSNKKRHILSLLKKQSIVQQQNQQKELNNYQINKKKCQQFILRNINWIKNERKLQLGKQQKGKNKKISNIVVEQKITKKLFEKVSSINIQTNLNFNQEQESDVDEDMEFEFQQKRRQAILLLNSKLYKNKNCNYITNKKKIQKNIQLQTEHIHGQLQQNNNQNNSKQLAFQEIKLLDQVIQDQISKYLNIKINYKKQKNFRQNSKKDQEVFLKNTGIIEINQAAKKMQKLKFEVDQMNKEHMLVIDKFNYQKNLLKMAQKYNSGSSNQEEVYHSGAFKQLDNIVNFKFNLTQKAENCISMYKSLMNLQNQNKTGIFDQLICKFGQKFKNKNKQTQNQSENQIEHQQNLEKIKLIEYLVEHRPKQEWEIKQEKKNYIKKFGNQEDNKINEIALRETFDTLRRNISKTQFNQNHVTNKNTNLKHFQA